MINPCLSCGACCAFFRVSFHWSETLSESHQVPVDLTHSISPNVSAMIGTDQKDPICTSLLGIIGKSASCGIYKNRPNCCRLFKPSFEDGFRNSNCEKARASKGLEFLKKSDWPIPLNQTVT